MQKVGMGMEQQVVDDILDSLDVRSDSVLIVHSAFRNFSQAGLTTQDFCAALSKRTQGGTLLMPAMSWREVNPQSPVFDAASTSSCTGVLSEQFRTDWATHRSLHPTHSVSGLGPLAGLLLGTHHEGTTPCAGNSPYGLMRDYDAHVLLLGVGLECCTAIHHGEEVMALDAYVREDLEPYTLTDKDGEAIQVQTQRHKKLDRDFPKFEAALTASPGFHSGTVCDTPWKLFILRELYRIVFSALSQNRKATLKDEGFL